MLILDGLYVASSFHLARNGYGKSQPFNFYDMHVNGNYSELICFDYGYNTVAGCASRGGGTHL